MVISVTDNLVSTGYGRALAVLRLGVVLSAFFLGFFAGVAPASGQTASEPAPSGPGEAWVAPPTGAPVAGTVATAPAPATGITVPTPPTPPAPATTGPAASGPVTSAPAKPLAQPSAEEVADANPEALTYFKPHLDPYGSWVDDPRYGRVWVPNRGTVGSQFSPYVTNGHWALDSDDNWIWVSDYPFGWVVFHYGRWFYSTEYGWAWVPGRTYAPNWVVWRLPSAEYAYVGWAPMPPRYGWFSTGAVWYSSYGTVSYVFCPSDYLFYPNVGVYLVRDPWMVSRLGIYTSFYYPPYYYGYYGYGHHHRYYGGYRGHAGYRPPAYGPPINRTRMSPRAIPRERVRADPRALSAAPRQSASPRRAASPTTASPSGFGGFQRSPVARDSRSAPSVSPRTSATPRTAPRTAPSIVTPRSEPARVPRTFVPRSSAPTVAPRVRSSAPTVRSTPMPRAPSVRSTPSFPSPRGSMPASPRSFGGGRRHR